MFNEMPATRAIIFHKSNASHGFIGFTHHSAQCVVLSTALCHRV